MIPLAKNIKRYFSLKNCAIIILAVVISITAIVGLLISLKKEVMIIDNGKKIVLKTMKSTVGEVLNQAEIKLGPSDYISLSLSAKLDKKEENKIHIKRAVPVNLIINGQQEVILTTADTVKEVLSKKSIVLNSKDRLEGASLNDKIVKSMKLRIIRVKEEIVSEEIPMSFKVIRKENSRLNVNEQKCIRDGKKGVKEKFYKVVTEDGKEIKREFVKETVTSKPIDKIVEYGTVLNHKTARGDFLRYDKVLNMRATAYTASYADTGKSPGHPEFGITYTGIRARKGIIAVDPRVIPLGTKVYVEVIGSTPDYGYAVAADIGGAIKGDLIDLYIDGQEAVDSWGCKRVKVYILSE